MEADEMPCPDCAEPIKVQAKVCRHCGHRLVGEDLKAKAAKRSKGIGCLVSIAIGLIFVVVMLQLGQPGSPLASTPLGVDAQMKVIQDGVAADAVKQYDIAAKSGTAVDACVQAGMVAAAYLQAQDQKQFDDWKQIEKLDCDRAKLER